jgi:hypothetical protein
MVSLPDSKGWRVDRGGLSLLGGNVQWLRHFRAAEPCISRIAGSDGQRYRDGLAESR